MPEPAVAARGQACDRGGMRRVSLAVASIVLVVSVAEAQKRPKAKAAEFGLTAYTSLGEGGFPDGWAAIEALSPDDVAETHDNLDDLAWLVPVARANKVVLLGENHYYRVTHHLAHRVLFALQQGAHFHLLTTESEYSTTPFIDHYVQLDDDAAAAAFYQAALVPMVDTAEERTLLERVRAWNKRNPKRRIHLAGHDIEHDYPTTITHVLAPYFRRLDPELELEVADFEQDGLGFIAELEALVVRARKARTVGDYPFVTADFIATVVQNLRSKHLAGHVDHIYYRQRAIVRNLTDPAYLGRWFRTGKVMLWGGSYHTQTRRVFPDGGAFLREGIYLATEHKPTRGKTYSISVVGLALSLGDMAGADPAKLGHMGDGYRGTLARFQRAHAAGAITADEAHLFGDVSTAHLALVDLARTVDHAPFRITNVAWFLINPFLARLPPSLRGDLVQARTDFTSHDTVIVVPRSPLIRQLPR